MLIYGASWMLLAETLSTKYLAVAGKTGQGPVRFTARQEPRPPNALVIVLERGQLQLFIERWPTLSPEILQQQIMLRVG